MSALDQSGSEGGDRLGNDRGAVGRITFTGTFETSKGVGVVSWGQRSIDVLGCGTGQGGEDSRSSHHLDLVVGGCRVLPVETNLIPLSPAGQRCWTAQDRQSTRLFGRDPLTTLCGDRVGAISIGNVLIGVTGTTSRDGIDQESVAANRDAVVGSSVGPLEEHRGADGGATECSQRIGDSQSTAGSSAFSGELDPAHTDRVVARSIEDLGGVTLASSRDLIDLRRGGGAVSGAELDDDVVIGVGIGPTEGGDVHIRRAVDISDRDGIDQFTGGTSADRAAIIGDTLDLVEETSCRDHILGRGGISGEGLDEGSIAIDVDQLETSWIGHQVPVDGGDDLILGIWSGTTGGGVGRHQSSDTATGRECRGSISALYHTVLVDSRRDIVVVVGGAPTRQNALQNTIAVEVDQVVIVTVTPGDGDVPVQGCAIESRDRHHHADVAAVLHGIDSTTPSTDRVVVISVGDC